MKTVIVGGVAGGASVAARLRRLDESAQIVMLEKGQYISYANCGLPYYIGGTIEDQDDILIQTPESFNARFAVDVRVHHEVIRIDRSAQEVVVRDSVTSKQYRESYDRLVLAPGAEPMRPPIPGVDHARVFTLRTVNDAERIKTFIDSKKPRRVIVVGAGFIGLEMAESLHQRDIFVTIVEMAPQVIAPLDTEMAAAIHQHLKTKNVEFYLSQQVSALKPQGDGIVAVLKSGIELPADFVIMSVGVKPDTRLAAEAGLEIGVAKGIRVNSHLQTSDEHIYALGDVIEYPDPVFNIARVIPLAGPANKQGRIVANNIVFANRDIYPGTVGTAIAKVFDLTVALTGFSERALRQAGVSFVSTLTHSSSNAGYYPGAMPLTIKLNYSKSDGKILGAQIVGFRGVDKACEVLSLACQKKMTIWDLMEMDQAYAPPYSSAKSPVNMACFVADNVIKGLMTPATWQDVKDAGEETCILDVRTLEETQLNRIAGALLIPLDQLRRRMNEIPRNKKIYVYCAVGLRSYIAARILEQNAFSHVYTVTGGFKTYEMAITKQSNEDIYSKYCIEKNDDFSSGGMCGSSDDTPVVEINARGLQCPGPIMKLNEEMKPLARCTHVKIYASDPGFLNDVKSWCTVTGNRLIDVGTSSDDLFALIEKGSGQDKLSQTQISSTNKTIIVFDDDFDRALAAFVIA
ncbi:MAG: FAD-dependent oxidoreductase, partial [Endomicrobiales bacterium]